MANKHILGMVLSGGGARGAYQAGVLRGIYEITREIGDFTVFRRMSGVSAGAINASFLAANMHDLDTATQQLCQLWSNIRAEQVFRTDYTTVTKNAIRLMRGLSLGGLSKSLRTEGIGLLNTEPLFELLNSSIDFSKIQQNVNNNSLEALCITATDYSTSLGVTFYAGAQDIQPWRSLQRVGIRSSIEVDHVMASTAIPVFFPPWQVGVRHYGDGCLRNTAPLSPGVHVGATKLLVIGVRRRKTETLDDQNVVRPSLGRVVSVLINAIFMDAVDVDLERLRIINEALDHIDPQKLNNRFRRLDTLYIHPSESLSDVALSSEAELPKIIRFLLQGLGTPQESAEILSYLMFEPGYCSTAVNMGLKDTLLAKEALIKFLTN